MEEGSRGKRSKRRKRRKVLFEALTESLLKPLLEEQGEVEQQQ